MCRHRIALSVLVCCASCTADRPPRARGELALEVAPLALEGIDRACYDVRVEAGGDLVWARGEVGLAWPGDDDALCSDRFGNGAAGDIAYVGTCDAEGPDRDGDGRGERDNTVTVWLDGLYRGAVDMGDYRDPCPDGCTLTVPCEENTDQEVAFDLTVLRAAKQGFFDVAVGFDDIFCSAKLDTCHATADGPRPIELLFGADGRRDHTAVLGLACSAGTDADTTLFLGRVTVTCGDAVFELDPTLAPGNQVATGAGHDLGFGIYRGDEALDCGGGAGSCHKRYWNLAIDLDDLAILGDCALDLEATAADGDGGFIAGLPTAAGQVYPYISIDGLALTVGGVAGCQENPLDGDDRWNGRDSRVVTAYRGNVGGVEGPLPMCWRFDGDGAVATDADPGACGTACPECTEPFVALEQVSDFAPGFDPDSATFPLGDDLLYQQGSLHRVLADGVVDVGNDRGLYLVHEPHFVRTGSKLLAIDDTNRLLAVDSTTGALAYLTEQNRASSWFKAELGPYAIVNVDLADGYGYEMYRYEPLGGFHRLGDLTTDTTETIDCASYDNRPFRCEEHGCTFGWDTGRCLGGTIESVVEGITYAVGGSFVHEGLLYFCVQHQHGFEVSGWDLVRTDGNSVTVVTSDTAFCGDDFIVDGDRVTTIALRDWHGGETLVQLDLSTDPPTELVLATGFPYGQGLQRADDGRLVAIQRRDDGKLTLAIIDGTSVSQPDPTLTVASLNLRIIGQRAYFAQTLWGCTDCGVGGGLDDGTPRASGVRWIELAAPTIVHAIDKSIVPELTDLFGTYRDWESYAGNQALFALGERVVFVGYTVSDGLVMIASDGTASGSTWVKTNAGADGAPFSRYGTEEHDGAVWFNNRDADGVGQIFRLVVAEALPATCAPGSHRDAANDCAPDAVACVEKDPFGNAIVGTQRWLAGPDRWSACTERSCAAIEIGDHHWDADPGPIASGATGTAIARTYSERFEDPAVRGRLVSTYQASASCVDATLSIGEGTLVATAVDQCAPAYYRAALGDAFCSPVPQGFCHFEWAPVDALEPIEPWFGPGMLESCNP